MICFSRCRTKSSKLRKSSCHQIMPLSKNQRNNLKKFWTKQKHYIQDFWIVPSFMFLITKKIVLEGFLSELKQKILYEPKESNCIKHQKKKTFSKKNYKLLPHKENFCWKLSSKIIYTFFLKHQKYPFCAPIFHPISETE